MASVLPSFEARIFIQSDGRVVFEHFTEELVEVASCLNPDDEQVCRRMEMVQEDIPESSASDDDIKDCDDDCDNDKHDK